MMAQINESIYTERYEYHGNTSIERIRCQDGITILRDWIMFDSVEDAETFFNDQCYLNTDWAN